MKLQNGMTKESLTFVIDRILGGALEKLEENFPHEITAEERRAFFEIEDVTQLTQMEQGIVNQAIGSIAIIAAQSIEDGIGDGDADSMLGDFTSACERFVASNWRDEGKPFMARYNKNMEGFAVFHNNYLWDEPNSMEITERFISRLEEWQTDDDED